MYCSHSFLSWYELIIKYMFLYIDFLTEAHPLKPALIASGRSFRRVNSSFHKEKGLNMAFRPLFHQPEYRMVGSSQNITKWNKHTVFNSQVLYVISPITIFGIPVAADFSRHSCSLTGASFRSFSASCANRSTLNSCVATGWVAWVCLQK